MKNKYLAITLLSLATACCLPFALASNNNSNSNIDKLIHNNQGLSPQILKMGINAYKYAKAHGQVNKRYLTIVNLSAPSKDKRLWVIDLKTDKIIAHTLVANGKNSGVYRGTKFSNKAGSDESSLGVYVTGKPYVGHDGYSMRLHGIEPGVNNNAFKRAIVMHPAWYVSKSFAKEHGRVGRSWGCFALSKTMAPKIIHIIKGGSVLFAYASPEKYDPAVNGDDLA